MSLDWSLSEINDWQKTCFEDWDETTHKGMLKESTNALIWACLLIDMNGLKDEKDVIEMAWRLNFMKVLGESYWHVWDGENDKVWWPTADDLRSHIGLHTNVATKSRTKFVNERVTRLKDKAERMTLQQLS
jgi:hypothetical protein